MFSATCILLALVSQSNAPKIANAGFESGTTSWEVVTYGAQPTVERDTTTLHGGSASLKISSDQLTDTALGQMVSVAPGHWYRFQGWVKTAGLDPHGAPVCGTYQVQGAGGTIVSGKSHPGDNDWTEVRLLFRGPSDGRVRICPFFVGFGKGTGTAWFDDLSIEETQLPMTPITVTRKFISDAAINPMQCGQFIEYLCNLVPGMWAEKLYDTGFSGLTPWGFFYFVKQKDCPEKPWYPSGAVNRAEYVLDDTTSVSPPVSQRITVAPGAPCTVGLSQDGVAVQKGTACTFSCWLKQDGLKGKVKAILRDEGKEIASCEFEAGRDWAKHVATLKPAASATNATFSIEFRGPATLWIDSVSLMPVDNMDGWRKDVVEALRALHCHVIRFGGSVLEVPAYGDFEWRKTVGERDHRRPFSSWGGQQPAGAGLEEFVQLCRLVGAEPLMCVRFTNSTPEEAAAQLQYFNGAVDTPMGALRAKNGHPEPYHIKYWQVGNEIVSEEYDAKLASFCKAMKKTDPSIHLASYYPTPALLKSAGQYLDYVSPHQYNCRDIQGCDDEIENIRKMIRENAPGHDIKIAVTEWNTTAGDIGLGRSILWRLENLLDVSRYHNLMHRKADMVEIANRSNLTNSFCSGIIQTDNHRLYKTPAYYGQELYATLAGKHALQIETDSEGYAALDVSATLSADGKTLTLFAVNDSLEPVDQELNLSAFGTAGQTLDVWTVADRDDAREPDVTNSFGDPERISARKSKEAAAGSKFKHHFPALSLTVIRWKVGK